MSKNKLKVSEYAIIDVASSNLVSINNNTSTINPIHAQFNMSFHDNSGREVARLYVTDDGEVDYEGSLTEGAINFIRELSVLSTAYAKDLNLIKLRDLEAILSKEVEKQGDPYNMSHEEIETLKKGFEKGALYVINKLKQTS